MALFLSLNVIPPNDTSFFRQTVLSRASLRQYNHFSISCCRDDLASNNLRRLPVLSDRLLKKHPFQHWYAVRSFSMWVFIVWDSHYGKTARRRFCCDACFA